MVCKKGSTMKKGRKKGGGKPKRITVPKKKGRK